MIVSRSAMLNSAATILLAVGTTPAFCQPTQTNKPQESVVSDPIPLDGILQWLSEHQAKNLYRLFEPPFLARIRKVGISFEPTQEILEKIRNAGGSEKLVSAIVEKGNPPTPKEGESSGGAGSGGGGSPGTRVSPVLKVGTLTVICQPVDCDVFVGTSSVGTTVSGELKLPWAESPEISVSVTRKDYDSEPNHRNVAINDKETTAATFKLTPSPAALAESGSRRFGQMLEALGGQEGLKAAEIVLGKATFKSYVDRTPTSWDGTALIKLPDKAKFELSAQGKNYEVGRTGDGFHWFESPKTVDLGKLEDCLRWLQDKQIANVVGRLQDISFKIAADQLTPGDGQPVVLWAKGGSETYKITLSADFRPTEIALESTGLDSGLKILYSDYVQKGSAYYPRKTQVVLPDAAHQRGFEVEFGDFDLNPPDIKDSDFEHGKKSGLSKLVSKLLFRKK